MSHTSTNGYYADSFTNYKSHTCQVEISGSLYIVAATYNDQLFLTAPAGQWLVTIHCITDPSLPTWHTWLPESQAMAVFGSTLPGWVVDQIYAMGG